MSIFDVSFEKRFCVGGLFAKFIFINLIIMEEFNIEYTKDSMYYRGQIISDFSVLEKRIEFIISDYFLGKLNNTFISIILDRLNFEAKRASLKAIFDELEKKSGLFKTEGNANPHKKIFDEINSLSIKRNHFAHYTLAYPENNDDNKIVFGLVENRDVLPGSGLRTKFYTKADVVKISRRILFVSEELEKRYFNYTRKK